MHEPSHDIRDPQGNSQWVKPAKGDTFDEFIRLTGGDPSPRKGHADSIKVHSKKIECETKPAVEEFYMGPVGIVPAVYTPRPPVEMYPAPVTAPVIKVKGKKR